MTLTTNQAVEQAAKVIRGESLRKRNGLRYNATRVALAWRVIEVAAVEIDPKATRRDLAITVVGLNAKKLYGGTSAYGFGGSQSAVVTGT